ncbi:CopM family metallochaperone [Caballeronia glebae]|uniref:CopM family metallochaperone n=1 Tax=Caballeronia glebae TaxID=1777143 RepID=UPI0038BAC676
MKYLPFIKVISVCAGVALSGASLTVHAQQSASMPAMSMSGSTAGDSNSATQAFKEGGAQMMKNMSAPSYTGNTDKDFVAHMIPHHQGAIDMAKVELKYGKDPDMKRLAKSIIKAQNEEIAYMKKWQAKHAGE